jgi:hypothetical protein
MWKPANPARPQILLTIPTIRSIIQKNRVIPEMRNITFHANPVLIMKHPKTIRGQTIPKIKGKKLLLFSGMTELN